MVIEIRDINDAIKASVCCIRSFEDVVALTATDELGYS